MSEIESQIKPPSCLDSAYERRAIDRGLVTQPVYDENINYMKLREYFNECIQTSTSKN